MSINNRRDYLDYIAAVDGSIITDHLLFGGNIQLAPGTYTPNWDTFEVDSVTFKGTAGKDAPFGGGGEMFSFFLGTRGDDLYGIGASPDVFVSAYADYSAAPSGVFVDMSYRGSRTFTDSDGETRTVDIVGKAHDGFGGTDYFAETPDWGAGYSSIIGVFGSSHRDVMIGGGGWDDFYGGGGDDLLIDGSSHGGAGNDRLIGRATGDWQNYAVGDEGDDFLLGTDFIDHSLIGGAGNDRIFAGDGDDGAGDGPGAKVIGNEGNDYVDGGGGDDFVDGGIGRDTLVSGSGNDIINPDVEYFQLDSSQPRDGARDVIRVTRADLGAYTDTVLFNAFEEDRDQIHFRDAVKGGKDFRIYQEEIVTLPGRVTTILQVDQNGDGFGDDTPDDADYFLVVRGADLSLHDGFLLT